MDGVRRWVVVVIEDDEVVVTEWTGQGIAPGGYDDPSGVVVSGRAEAEAAMAEARGKFPHVKYALGRVEVEE